MNRRGFLQGAAAGAASLALGLWKLQPRDASARTVSQAATPPEYTGWADVYRAKWTWDRVGRSTHFVNCWPQAHCTWNVYMKDGIVWREEQAGDYPQTRADVPDFNPRGCQKGGCYSERMYRLPSRTTSRSRTGRSSRCWRRPSSSEHGSAG